MNLILESLFLRKVRLEYVAPPVCPIILAPASSSSQIAILNLATILPPPTPVFAPSQGNILTWTPLATACAGVCQQGVELAYAVYQSATAGGSYNLLQTNIPPLTTSMQVNGCYEATAVDENGIEIAVSSTLCGSGILITMPVALGAVNYNLYKDGVRILSNYSGEAFQVSSTGFYRLGFITPDGATPLSSPIFVTI